MFASRVRSSRLQASSWHPPRLVSVDECAQATLKSARLDSDWERDDLSSCRLRAANPSPVGNPRDFVTLNISFSRRSFLKALIPTVGDPAEFLRGPRSAAALRLLTEVLVTPSLPCSAHPFPAALHSSSLSILATVICKPHW